MRDFHWRDGERTIVFGRDALTAAPALLGDGYGLLTTERGRSAVPALAERAKWTAEVAPGRVDEVAEALLGEIGHAGLVVALGGGRVIDVGKAVAAARGARTAAVPTTLSGAEMTHIHRHATGVDPSSPRVRPVVVLNDPALSASQPGRGLAASAANALGHAVEATLTPRANPVGTLAAHAAAMHLAEGLPAEGEPDRARLALGALLAGYATDSAGYGLHHVLAQTLARFAGIGHGAANAAMLPHSTRALRRRFPGELAALDAALGVSVEEAAATLASLAGAESLGAAGADRAALPRCAEAAAERAELAQTPPVAGRDELLELYETAW